ncbi:MAG: TatD family hydrolase [Opitutaceae bacterium]|nr:TatD family hydrolase [Verrucomicrobiales bacterium]
MRLHDAHNHLQDDRFGGHQDELVATTVTADVVRMVVNGSCEEDWPAVQDLARRHPCVLPSFGYHPWYLAERTPNWQSTLKQYLDATPGAVVGEIGLDRWKPDLPYDGQEDAFVWQLRLAAERNLAVSIHCLRAWGRLHELIRAESRPARGFLLHSYGGPVELVKPLARLGAYFSFPGYYLHERKIRQRETFKHIPPDRLLIETDAPDQLPPDHLAGFHALTDSAGHPINHPANLQPIYNSVAEILGEPLEAFALRIEENFNRLFDRRSE